jgi:phosphatidate cytidylyltransferase
LLYAALLVVTATFGDLVESMLKRNMGVKDSGTIFPGHGGVLDRFDAVLFAAPFAFVFLIFVTQ